MNKRLMKACGFGAEIKRVEQGRCPFCNNPVGTFRDRESRAEFKISGLCQACQDSTFGK